MVFIDHYLKFDEYDTFVFLRSKFGMVCGGGGVGRGSAELKCSTLAHFNFTLYISNCYAVH